MQRVSEHDERGIRARPCRGSDEDAPLREARVILRKGQGKIAAVYGLGQDRRRLPLQLWIPFLEVVAKVGHRTLTQAEARAIGVAAGIFDDDGWRVDRRSILRERKLIDAED